ncbi:hypothetical protein GCM10027275_46400 [Rhabdobacter roseus]|uniref:Uncharacterized protein n=1 Tax=Rhabdobacter roseus TaxID=1655419 RepID=A0A840U3K1_9BACT|nr:hypothetical protein [Rhabdobacter roseus]MBB5286690.1 hypothetical protein [Rhabdobacter roseus]
MKKSNIFAYVELSKLAKRLQEPATTLKEELKAQSAYFNIIPAKYFSETLVGDWEAILQRVHLQPEYSTAGREATSAKVPSRPAGRPTAVSRLPMNAAALAIEQMSEAECSKLAKQILALFQKLEKEFV